MQLLGQMPIRPVKSFLASVGHCWTSLDIVLDTFGHRGGRCLGHGLAQSPVGSSHEITDLTRAIVAINGWKRICIAFRSVPGEYEPAAVKEPARQELAAVAAR
jgi:hypothetical protein